MTAVVGSLEELVGGTPLLRLQLPGLGPGTSVLAKLEWLNPMFSVKDRAVVAMLRAAERRGELPPTGGTVVECSSGSTGISLAALCAARGHRCIVVLPDNATRERRAVLEEYGAEVVLVPAEAGLLAAWRHAEGLRDDIDGAWMPHQDTNAANVEAHYRTTGPEIWDATGGQVDVFVCGVGTGGTLTGVARFLKSRRDVRVVAVEPAGAAVLSGGSAGPHGIPGIGAGYLSEITDVSVIDEVVAVPDEAAMERKRFLSRSLGLLVGVSSGAAVYACERIARTRPGATIVTVLPDSGERYLSLSGAAHPQSSRRREVEDSRI